ncbi:unnamed protein product [Rotaria magnacalcarata]|uniref:SWIM-type domain-containing protein n=1 Tax=Rotaria magnacalcarata TaxID=392030 RepID=A0A816NYB1_9BILA|nr:unnamed protein product [Rotaria magnacalcarata]
MPNTSREKCVMCEESFDQVEMRTIGDGLLRVYVAVRLSKRIFSEDYICQRWRLQFFHWLRVMEGDFDRFCSRDISDNEFFTNDDDKIAMVVDNYEERIVESSVQNDPQTPRISIPVFRCSKSHQTDCWTLDSFGLQVLLTDIRSMLLQQNSFNFDDPTSLNEEAYKTIVGLTKVNAQLKQWKYFSQTIPNSSLCFLSNYIDITCALINAYGSRCVQDIHSGTEIATQMLQKCQTTNSVQLRLLELLETKLQWKKYDAQLLIFPELTEQELRNICYGTYQIKQAKSYIREHLKQSPLVDNDMEFIIELCAQYDDLVRVRFESRHCNNKTHIATVQFKLYTESPISGWYCTCTSGWRDVGCCAHVAALLWHLGVRRANISENTHPLSADHLFASIDDSMQFSEVEKSDEDQDDNNNDTHVYSVASNSTNSDNSTSDEEIVD